MITAKNSALCLVAALTLAVGFSIFQYREIMRRDREAALLIQERSRLQEMLRESEQRSMQFEKANREAEKQLSELERKLGEVYAARSSMPAKSNRESTSSRATPLDKMATLKPLLEAGMPIKGAIVMLVDGKPVQQHVEFLIGKETRMDAGDDGIYLVTPTMRADGAVKYGIKLKKNPETDAESLPTVVLPPWKGFTMGGGGNGRALAFDPDMSEP